MHIVSYIFPKGDNYWSHKRLLKTMNLVTHNWLDVFTTHSLYIIYWQLSFLIILPIWYNHAMKRFIAILIFVAYITLGSLGFFFMADTNHQFHNFNCPFMPGEKSLCSMNIFEHVSSWVNMFTSFVPTIFFLFLSSILISYFYI